MVILLNTSILTAYGSYQYKPLTLLDVKLYLIDKYVQSAIGHQSTAEILTKLLEIPVYCNRINFNQQVGDTAIVFKLKSRVPEGVILSREQVEEIGYEFGILHRNA